MKKNIVITGFFLLAGLFVQGQHFSDLIALPIGELVKRPNWSLVEQKVLSPDDTLFKCLVENKSLFVAQNGLQAVDAKLSDTYVKALWGYATGKVPYDPAILMELFQGLMAADLPDDDLAYRVYDLAKCRGKKEYARMLEMMATLETELGKERTIGFDLTLGEIPELTNTVRELFVNYLTVQSGKYKTEKAYLPVIRNMTDYKGIVFEESSFSDAAAKAAEEDKLIFMDAYTVWCGPCKMMSEKVFVQDKVGTFFNKTFVNVKMDMEKGEGVELAKKYNIRLYPTFLLLKATGEVVSQIAGYHDADSFLEFFRGFGKK